ncbi:MAG: hypothetical protein KF833_08035 [Verrucomicrobiae bacterium]|nr:hypothetical protein [Verrucomicrobiae bacterium]
MEPHHPPPHPGPERDWPDCDVFCITGYAGTETPCGWRGRFHETEWDDASGTRRCPRCHRTSLLGVDPLDAES